MKSQIPEMVPFKYVDFYDVPRCIAFRYRGTLFLLQSAFDYALDDYPDVYTVFVLPDSVKDSLEVSSWDFLENTPMDCVGHIQISSVEFDPSKRKELDPSCLDDVVRSLFSSR